MDYCIKSVADYLIESFLAEELVEGQEYGNPIIGPFVLLLEDDLVEEIDDIVSGWKNDMRDAKEGGSRDLATPLSSTRFYRGGKRKNKKFGGAAEKESSSRGFGWHTYDSKPPKGGSWEPAQAVPQSRGYLIGVDTNTKSIKGQKKGYMTGLMYLTPGGMDGMQNTCGASTPGCRGCCLKHAGRLRIQSHALAARTKLYYKDRDKFMELVDGGIAKAKEYANKKGHKLVIRLNGTSDLPFHSYRYADGSSLMDRHKETQFYDYTKFENRMRDYMDGKLPSNYHLTFSRSERNHNFAMEVINRGHNVAVPFDITPNRGTHKSGDSPLTFHGHDVIDGDESDLRFLDHKHTKTKKANKTGKGVWVGLRVKGKEARDDESGFIVKNWHEHP